MVNLSLKILWLSILILDLLSVSNNPLSNNLMASKTVILLKMDTKRLNLNLNLKDKDIPIFLLLLTQDLKIIKEFKIKLIDNY